MQRRAFLSLVAAAIASATLNVADARAESLFLKRRRRKAAATAPAKKKPRKTAAKAQRKRPIYEGREEVAFHSGEKPGTIVIRTRERALYQVLGDGRAMRYLVAVGKEGFSWSGVARIGMKRVNPKWTPPPEMIKRTPKYAKWSNGMPGGNRDNPLGARAMYLFTRKGDTGFRIHGTIYPSSIGTAASSGCIRMLNREVIELYGRTPVGTKVIVI